MTNKSNKYPLVTIIVPTVYGGEKPLECLTSIKKLNYPQEKLQIVLIDNNTPDKFYKKIGTKFGKVITIRNSTNVGFPKSVNMAIKKAPASYFFITNDDIVFEKNSLKTLIDFASNNPKVGICGGKQLNYQTKRFMAGGRYFNLFTGQQKNIKGIEKKPINCDQVDGCAMLIKKEVVESIGLFDEGFSPIYGEDLDYCLRAKRVGYLVTYIPAAIFHHHHAHTMSKSPLPQVYFLGFRNRLRVIMKHANPPQILSFFIYHYLLVLPFRVIIKREPIIVPEVRALIWNIKKVRLNFFLSLLLITLFGGLFRILFSIFLPLDPDEAHQLLISKISVVQMLKATLSAYPPIWSLILHSTQIITSNYIFIRLLSSLIGLISIVMIGYLGRIIFNSSRTALLVSIIFALSPTQIYHSANVRVYSLSILASILVLLTLVKFLKSQSLKNSSLLFFSSTFGNYVYYLFPVFSFSIWIYLLLKKKLLRKAFRIYSLIFLLSVIATIPLFFAFMKVEPVPKEILPRFFLTKAFLIPIHYTFAQNLALLMSTKTIDLNLSKLLLLGLALVNSLIVILIFSKKQERYTKFLVFIMILPILLVILFSYLIFSVFGLRSILIFSIPFYLLIGKRLGYYKQLIKKYLIFSIIVVLFTSFFFIKKPQNELDLFLISNMNQDDIILHSEITSFYYFAYKFPQYKHFAAIDSLYTNKITKILLGYLQLDQSVLNSNSFWLIKRVNSPLHEDLLNQFQNKIEKTHKIKTEYNFGEVKISKYKPR